MALLFEWDERKAAENSRKHGVSFEEAASTFGDPASLTIDDPLHSESEDRFAILGISLRRRLLVTAFTERGDRIRVVSSRRATPNEQAQYEQRFRKD
jgi:uncharacterized DUF497 family protein